MQEWQAKGLWVTGFVRVATARLKVVLFSLSSVWPVRVAGKGLSERKLIVDSSKWNGRGKEVKAEASSTRRREELGEEEDDWLDCGENMGQGSIRWRTSKVFYREW